jgi:hypothetical protein
MDDDELIAELRRMTGEADPVPDQVRQAAAAAFAFRDPDAALAELIGDSEAGVGFETVRADRADDRVLSYELDGVRADLELAGTGDGPVLTGQLLAAGPEDCELETGDGDRLSVPVDEYGRFLVTEVPSGPARLRFRSVGGAAIVTPWFVL